MQLSPFTKEAVFSCPAGFIYRLNTVGLNPSSNTDQNSCTISPFSDSCGDYFNAMRFRIKFYDECMHKKACIFHNIDSFLSNETSKAKPECADKRSYIFVQYECNFDTEELPERAKIGLIVMLIDIAAMIILFLSILFVKF
jgi:hypothetical protein